MDKLPDTVFTLLNSVDHIYDYEKDSDWIGNCEVDYAWPKEKPHPTFSVFFTDDGYGVRGSRPDEVSEREAVIATIGVFELAEIEYELPEKLK